MKRRRMSTGGHLVPSREREAGTTLPEVLVAVSILGVAFASLVGGVATSAIATDAHRRQANGELAVRAAAESIEGAVFQPCASGYTTSGLPAGWSATVEWVRHWDVATSTFSAACPLGAGAQLVRLSVTDGSGRVAETVEMVKRAP